MQAPYIVAAGLARIVGLPGAVLMGLGSIVGSGLFISVALAATIAGPSVVLAVAIAAVVAVFNGLSSAQLAASHPVSGGTYEHGYRYLTPVLGFTAGWLFLCAKAASAATAALGFAHYSLAAVGVDRRFAIPVALALVGILTALVAGGLRRSHVTNTVIVTITLVALAVFVAVGLPGVRASHLAGVTEVDPGSLFHATALIFVAYTGYGRIATLGEEVRDPARTIPRAMIVTLAATLVLYLAVITVAVGTLGAAGLATAAPLEAVAATFALPEVRHVVAFAAVTAMIGVLLNLLLGLSRVVLAMARRDDLPPALATVHRDSPRRATIATGVVIAGLVLVGDVKATWSFSAFTVLVYYAITNLAALRLPPEHRRYPRWLAAAGLASCLALAFWVEPRIWIVGLGVIAAGLVWRLIYRQVRARS
jgi:APA family basic amino acid/polyamine antiporter